MGIAGGRPNSSLFFAGYQGDNLVYYDPHFIRPSLPLRDINSYQHKDLFSYHCDKVRFLRISSLDPSMVLGFLVKNEDEFLIFCENVKDVSRHHESVPNSFKLSPTTFSLLLEHPLFSAFKKTTWKLSGLTWTCCLMMNDLLSTIPYLERTPVPTDRTLIINSFAFSGASPPPFMIMFSN